MDEKSIVLESFLRIYGHVNEFMLEAYIAALGDCETSEIKAAVLEWTRDTNRGKAKFTPADILQIVRDKRTAKIAPRQCKFCSDLASGNTPFCASCYQELDTYESDLKKRTFWPHWPIRVPRPEIADFVHRLLNGNKKPH